MKVLEHDQDRPGAARADEAGQQVRRIQDVRAASAVEVARRPRPARIGGADQRLEGFARAGEPRRAPQVAREVDQQAAGRVDVAGEGSPAGHHETIGEAPPLDGGCEPCLADPGLACEEEQPAPARERLRATAVGKREEVVPADEDRADVGPRVRHGGESTT